MSVPTPTRWQPTPRLLLLPLVAALCLFVLAGGREARAADDRPAEDERLATRHLWRLAWHDDWKAAVLRNRFDPRDARPIVHLRILGDLAAKT